jgi:hypothetical protein
MKCMTSNLLCAAVVTWLTFGTAAQVGAQVLTNRAFDIVLQDDDPGASFTFELSPDPLVPSVLRFDGFFQNLEPLQTGVRYDLSWSRPDGGFAGSLATDWTPLPSLGQLPVQFEQSVPFTPASVNFYIEGGGPTDHFRFVGDFTIAQVPEPTIFTLLGTGSVFGLLCRRFRRARTYAA